MARLVEMVVESVRVHMLSNRHVVILKDNVGDRYLPIWIGAWEASAIAMRLQGLAAERPLTHDLFTAALDQLGVRVARVVVSDLADETYHAQLVLERDGIEEEVDARPSDALAIAVRTESPIYCAESVLAQAALSADPDEEGTSGEDVGDAEPGAPGEGTSLVGDEGERPRRRRAPLESVGNAPADPRLDMFRDFVNSLEVDPNAGGGGGDTGGRRG
jgi:bifunctional DNase/RNase